MGVLAAADAELHRLEGGLVFLAHQQNARPPRLGDDRHGGHQGVGLHLTCLEADVGGHADAQLGGLANQAQHHIEGGDVVELHGPGGDALDPCFKAFIGKGIHPHRGALAQLHTANVAFRHLGHHLQALG